MKDLLLNLRQRHYHYDALGQLTHIQQPQQVQYYAYDAHGRLSAARLGDEDSARQNWRFDAAGNPLPPAHAPQPTPQDWAETVRHRWQEPGFNLIQPDTQTPKSQAHCWPDNRVGFSEHERYQYDAQGNRTESHNTQTGDIRRYTYNALNQLVQLDHYTTDNQLERSTYLYDPLGRRLCKHVEHYRIEQHAQQGHLQQLTATAPGSIEYYGWDGDRLTYCNDQSQQWHYLYEPDSFTPMLLVRQDSEHTSNEGEQILKENMAMFEDTVRQLPNGEAEEARQQMREHIISILKQQGLWQIPELPQQYFFYHCNHLGLPDALTDQDGNIAWAAEYDPWGKLQSEHNPQQLKQAIRLPGQYHDPETGLYYNRHRYYDPALGSYINQDPIGLDSGEPNFYAYPRNPLQGVDPLGLELQPGKLEKLYRVGKKVRDWFDMKESYAQGQEAAIRDKTLSCQADEEHRKRLEEGHYEYSSELARGAKEIANTFSGPVSDIVEKDKKNAIAYGLGRFLTTPPDCEVLLKKGETNAFP